MPSVLGIISSLFLLATYYSSLYNKTYKEVYFMDKIKTSELITKFALASEEACKCEDENFLRVLFH